MNNIYDNGRLMLGQVKRLKEYNDSLFKREKIGIEQWVELAKELIWYNDYSIVSIDYDNNNGMIIELWDENDILKEEE